MARTAPAARRRCAQRRETSPCSQRSSTGGLVLPTLYWGTERERAPEMLDWLGFDRQNISSEWIFPANSLPSMYCSEEVFALLVREQLRLALRMGFRIMAVITGHAAENQMEVLQRLAAELTAERPGASAVVLPFVTNHGGHHGSRACLADRDGGHAGALPRNGAP